MVTATTVLDHTITTVPYIANRTDKPVQPPSPPNAPEQMLPLDPAEKKPNPSQPSSIVITPPAWLNVYPSSWLMLPDQPRWRHRVCTPTHRPQALNLVAVPNAQQESISTKQPVFIQRKGRIEPCQYEEGRRHSAYPFQYAWRYFSKPQHRIKRIYSKSRQRHTKSPLNAVLHNKQAVHLAYIQKPHYLLNTAYQPLSTATDTNGDRQNSSSFSVPQYKLPHTVLLFLSRRIAQLTNHSRRRASLFRPQLKRLARASVLSWPVAHHPPHWTRSVHSPADGQQALNCAAVLSAQQESISTKQAVSIQRKGRIEPRQYEEGRRYSAYPLADIQEPTNAPYHSPSTDTDAASDTDDEWYDEHEQNSLNCSGPQYALPLPSKDITRIKPHQYKGEGRIKPCQYEEGRRYSAYPLADIQEPANAPYHSPSTDTDATTDTDDEWYDDYDENEQNSLNCSEPQKESSETMQPAAHSIATPTGDPAQTERPIFQWVRKNLARIETIFAKLALRHNRFEQSISQQEREFHAQNRAQCPKMVAWAQLRQTMALFAYISYNINTEDILSMLQETGMPLERVALIDKTLFINHLCNNPYIENYCYTSFWLA